ncbi:helix-turn-helix domain-containing protein [Microbacterium sp. F51-2R]|uniref:helix-turn-helix domain-containing protein n=1 Tax=Microbacterium sp. F51-2R TaxID=3445777 RepID=UPI003FA05236
MTAHTHPEVHPGSLVSLAVAAGEFGVSIKTVRRRISDGTVHGYLVGRLIRVDLEELRERMLVEIPTRKRVDR